MVTLTENERLVLTIGIVAIVVLFVAALSFHIAMGSSLPQATGQAAGEMVTAQPTPAPQPTIIPVPTLPQVLQITASDITFANGRPELDGTTAAGTYQVIYFPDIPTCQEMQPGATYLFTPTGMIGSAYLVSDSYTTLSSPYDIPSEIYPDVYTPDQSQWIVGHIYTNGARWFRYNRDGGYWSDIQPSKEYQNYLQARAYAVAGR